MSTDAHSKDPAESIDVDAVRDTLRYIESDLTGGAKYAQLRSIIGLALAELGRIDGTDLQSKKSRMASAIFIPARR